MKTPLDLKQPLALDAYSSRTDDAAFVSSVLLIHLAKKLRRFANNRQREVCRIRIELCTRLRTTITLEDKGIR